MKFDCIIMNPPYQRNLHLKILAEAIKHYAKASQADIARCHAEFVADKNEMTCTYAIAVELGTYDNGKFTVIKEF